MKQRLANATFQPVSWSYAWCDPWRRIGQEVERHLHGGQFLWQALNQTAGSPVRFVSHAELPAGTAYERFIAQTSLCPTRPGLHDFFNGLCWIHFPLTKQRLNQLQSAQIAAGGIGATRGAVRDALTLFDENAAFMEAPDALWDALQSKQWHRVFVDLRPLWQEVRLVVFGHALLEKLQSPRKPITAHVYRTFAQSEDLAALDAWVAQDLDGPTLGRKPFAHLPVLGVPGWWQANQNPAFYEDSMVFRMPQTCRAASHVNNRSSCGPTVAES